MYYKDTLENISQLGDNLMRRAFVSFWLGMVVLLIVTACAGELPIPTIPPTSPTPAHTATSTLAPPTPTPTPTPEPLAALVNGQPILLADYERQVASCEASKAAAGQDGATTDCEGVLDFMIGRLLIKADADRAGVTVSDEEVEASLQTLREDVGDEVLENWLVDNAMSLEEFYEEQRDGMLETQMASLIASEVPTRTEHVHARHILVDTEEEARQILSQIQAGGDFISLARTYSKDTITRDDGGDLKFFPRNLLFIPEVEAAAFAMQPGQVSDVIQSEQGYHIVQVVARNSDMEVTPENLHLLRENAVRAWSEELRATAEIQRFVATPTSQEDNNE